MEKTLRQTIKSITLSTFKKKTKVMFLDKI